MNHKENIDWLESKRSLYESNKDYRIMHELNEKGCTAYPVYSDDPRYKEIAENQLTEKFKRCLDILEEMDILIKQIKNLGHP